MEAVLTLLVGVLLTLAIIAACGFFVAQEFAYMSVDRSRIAAGVAAGDAQAKRVQAITKRTSFMLSGAQLGITVTGLLIGYVAEPLIGQSLGTLLGGVGIDPAVSVLVGTTLALIVATVVTMIFGELFPKNYAIANPEPLARALAVPTRIYLLAFGWLITIFDHAANALLRLVRIEPLEDVDASATARDLEAIVEESRESGHLPADVSLMIDRILDFPERDVEHAMVPRSRVDAVAPESTIGEVRALMAVAHTRYPIVDEHDSPVGVVHLVDVLRSQAPDTAPVTEIMREAVVLPATMLLPLALDRMQRSRNELACVVDEHGSFDGILTIEDLTEEVVGELADEHDVDEAEVVAEGDHAWVVPGDVHVDEVERLIGHDLPEGDEETIAGVAIRVHGDLPAAGEVVRVDLPEDAGERVEGILIDRWLEVEVVAVERHVPSQVVLRLVELDREATAAEADADDASTTDEEVVR
nr:hemolysin family protein [Agrococcus sp. SGAir0287]